MGPTTAASLLTLAAAVTVVERERVLVMVIKECVVDGTGVVQAVASVVGAARHTPVLHEPVPPATVQAPPFGSTAVGEHWARRQAPVLAHGPASHGVPSLWLWQSATTTTTGAALVLDGSGGAEVLPGVGTLGSRQPPL